MSIAPSAKIDRQAQVCEAARIGPGVHVGRFAYVGPEVTLAEDVVVMDNARIDGQTSIGARTQIFPYALLGNMPQHVSKQDQGQALEIGHDSVLREFVSAALGLEVNGGVTRIGNHCYCMSGVHIGHDCRIGDGVIIANYAQIAGSASIAERAVLGSMALIHQFARVGTLAMVGSRVTLLSDLPPYAILNFSKENRFSINRVGLRRHGFGPQDVRVIRDAYRYLFPPPEIGTFSDRARTFTSTHAVTAAIAAFVKAPSKRHYYRPLFSASSSSEPH